MLSFSRILVGIDLSHSDRIVSEDLSQHCQQAVSSAMNFAKASGGEITFFSTLEISEQARHLIETRTSNITSSVEVEGMNVLNRLVEEASKEGVKASAQLAYGTAWFETIKEAVNGQYTLVIIGRRGSRSSNRFFFGSTVTQLIRKCPVPVMIAKPDPVREVESVLVADDLSEIGETVLDAGVQIARMREARLHVVSVVEHMGGTKQLFNTLTKEDVENYKREEEEKCEAALNDRLSRTDYRTLTHGAKVHVKFGTPENAILDLIDSEQADLIVIGSIGRTGFAAMLLGSTAERLMSTADASLLIIKPNDFKCPVSLD